MENSLRAAVDSGMASDRGNLATVGVSRTQVELRCGLDGGSNYEGSFPVENRSQDACETIVVNLSYLADAVAHCSGEVLRFGYDGEARPIVISDDSAGILAAIMPIRR